MSKTLLIMRHAKSSWDHPGMDDFDRPLNPRGLRDAPRMGEWIRDHQLVPDLIYCSTANRAKSTSKLIVESSGYEGDVRYLDYLYHGNPEDYFRAIKPTPVSVNICMVIGHNPGLERLIEKLTDVCEFMSTAAVAVVKLDLNDWEQIGNSDVDAELDELWRPKEI